MTEDKLKSRGAIGNYKCQCCKQDFEARVADRKRGWAKFCSKSCKAKKQEQRTGQMTNYLMGKGRRRRAFDIEDTFHPHDPYSLGQE